MNLQLTKLVGERAPAPAAGGAGAGAGAVDAADAEAEERLNLDAVVGVLTQMLHRSSVHTKVAALDWILHLYNKLPDEVSPFSIPSYGGPTLRC